MIWYSCFGLAVTANGQGAGEMAHEIAAQRKAATAEANVEQTGNCTNKFHILSKIWFVHIQELEYLEANLFNIRLLFQS